MMINTPKIMSKREVVAVCREFVFPQTPPLPYTTGGGGGTKPAFSVGLRGGVQ